MRPHRISHTAARPRREMMGAMMADPIVTAAAIGVVVAPVAGRALLRGFESMPERWHRGTAWLLVGGVVAIAAATALSSDGAMKEGAFILLLGALPGIIAFIAFQTALASAVVALVPLYFGIGAMTL